VAIKITNETFAATASISIRIAVRFQAREADRRSFFFLFFLLLISLALRSSLKPADYRIATRREASRACERTDCTDNPIVRDCLIT
jgi:hypothetical protein